MVCLDAFVSHLLQCCSEWCNLYRRSARFSDGRGSPRAVTRMRSCCRRGTRSAAATPRRRSVSSPIRLGSGIDGLPRTVFLSHAFTCVSSLASRGPALRCATPAPYRARPVGRCLPHSIRHLAPQAIAPTNPTIRFSHHSVRANFPSGRFGRPIHRIFRGADSRPIR